MFLSGGMQPDKAAITLVRVEEEWQSFAKASVECHEEDANVQHCQQAKSSFSKSCGTVLDAIVQGSSGDQNKVKTYMDTVCSEPPLQGWHKSLCQTLEDGLDKAMMFNANDNKVRFHSAAVCDSVWKEFIKDEQNRMEKERQAAKEQLLRASAEAEARAKERQAQEEVLEKKRQEEEARRLEEEAEMKAAKAKKEEEERVAREKEEKEEEKEEKERKAREEEAAKKDKLRIALEKAEEAQEKAKKAAAEAAALTAQNEEKKAAAQAKDAHISHDEQQSVNRSANTSQVATQSQIIRNQTEIVKIEQGSTNAITSLPASSDNFAAFGHTLPHSGQTGKIVQSEGGLVKAAVILNVSANISLPKSSS